MAEIVPLGNGTYRVVDETRSRIAYAAGPPEARWVFLDGEVFLVSVGRPFRSARSGRAANSRSHDHPTIAAPMPATVLAINVEPGQRVSKGDVLILLEAMKMELPIRAPRDGVIKALACRPGELVQPGVPLLELE